MGSTKHNTWGTLKIRGTGKNSNMRGHTKFLGGLIKIQGERLSGGLLQRGVLQPATRVKCRFYPDSGSPITLWEMTFHSRKRHFILESRSPENIILSQKPSFYPGNRDFQKMSFCPRNTLSQEIG